MEHRMRTSVVANEMGHGVAKVLKINWVKTVKLGKPEGHVQVTVTLENMKLKVNHSSFLIWRFQIHPK